MNNHSLPGASVEEGGDLVSQLVEVSQLDRQSAFKILQSCGGNLESAINAFLDMQTKNKHAASASLAQTTPKSAKGSHQTGTKRKAPSPPNQPSIASFFLASPSTKKEAVVCPEAVIDAAEPLEEVTVPKPIPAAPPAQQQQPAMPRDAVAVPLDKYNPIEDAVWQVGEPTPYLHLSRALEAIDGTTKRLLISDILVNTFRSVLALTPQNLTACALLLMGLVGPHHEGIQLGVGGSSVSQAVCDVSGVTKQKLSELYGAKGDLGDAAILCKQKQVGNYLIALKMKRGMLNVLFKLPIVHSMLRQPTPLTVPGVMTQLKTLASMRGQGSGNRKRQTLVAMFRACRESEIKYLVRTLVQALRVGANERTIVPAVAKAIAIHKEGSVLPKTQLDTIANEATAAFHVCPDLDRLVTALLEHPCIEIGKHCGMVPGLPVKCMLGKISAGPADAVALCEGGAFFAEWKYDGVRAQIHIGEDLQSNKVFSRNNEDATQQYHDAIETVRSALSSTTTSLVLDAEIVAVSRAADGSLRLKPFQELMTRSRNGGDVKECCIFVFDILQHNQVSLLNLSLVERRVKLQDALPGMRPGYIQLAESREFDPDNEGVEEQVQEYMLQAFDAGTEGLMLKSLCGTYEPSKRSAWVKLKRDYCDGLHDTLDLVVIGAWTGNGRKVKWYSPFLLAAYDPETETYCTVCRCMSGFSDEFYQDATARLEKSVIPGPRPYYHTNERPQVWFESKEVWEIRGADLTLSTVHTAAQGLAHEDKGISLRFPRFVRVREDKSPEDATTTTALAQMYAAQSRRIS